VGEGPSRKELEGLVASLGLKEHVHFVGDVAHHELCRWYNAADIFCLASSREGWPNVVLESLACGTPVVATEVWGTPEIIRSDDIGLLTKRTDQDIANALERALERTWNYDVIRDYAASHTWERVAAAVRDVFESVVRTDNAVRNA
jgi:glycosyltransferase involved in cell wall biosynthesis